MLERFRFVWRYALVALALIVGMQGLFLTQGCDCGGEPGRFDAPMEISFVYPSGTLITEGKITAKAEDLDAISSMVFYIDGKKVGSKTYDEGEEKQKATITVTFDYAAAPRTFKIEVRVKDTLDNEGKKSLNVRKPDGFPFLSFTAPKKLKPEHKAIFVGKKFKTEVEASDPDGAVEVQLKMAPYKLSPEDIRKCVDAQGKKKFLCGADVDVSPGKYPEGPLVLLATAKDKLGNAPDRDKRLEVIVDKTGPQIKINRPLNNEQLAGTQLFQALAVDQTGVAKVEFFLGGKPMGQATPDKAGRLFSYSSATNGFGSGTIEFKVVATDNLGNVSQTTINVKLGCRTDQDCEAIKAGSRCCLGKSPANKDGKFTGTCYDVQKSEGGRCDPCTNPCGKGQDGKLMGCLPGACGRPPYLCRRACNRGNPNRAPDRCQAASGGRPAEYCAPSDITRIDASLGACALGDNCNPFTQQVCPPGTKPPYKNCCPSGFGCFPADEDANICVPEGSKNEKDTNCTVLDCAGGANCKKGLICSVTVDRNGKPQGPSSCTKMCRCDARCRAAGGDFLSRECGFGGACVPLQLINGKVPLPVGACRRF